MGDWFTKQLRVWGYHSGCMAHSTPFGRKIGWRPMKEGVSRVPKGVCGTECLGLPPGWKTLRSTKDTWLQWPAATCCSTPLVLFRQRSASYPCARYINRHQPILTLEHFAWDAHHRRLPRRQGDLTRELLQESSRMSWPTKPTKVRRRPWNPTRPSHPKPLMRRQFHGHGMLGNEGGCGRWLCMVSNDWEWLFNII